MAQCTMHSCTWHIFWVQFVQHLGHHTMCSFLSLFGILLVQCTASIVCSIPWRFFGILHLQCSVNIHFPLCAAFNVHCLQYFLAASDMRRYFVLHSGTARTSVCNIHRVVCSQTVFNVVLCAIVNFHGSFLLAVILFSVLYCYCNVWFVKCCVCFQCHM